MKKVTEESAPKNLVLKSKAKTDLMPLNMERCIQTFDQNQTMSPNLLNEGKRLLRRITGDGIDEKIMVELTGYVGACSSVRTEMHERRESTRTSEPGGRNVLFFCLLLVILFSGFVYLKQQLD